MNTVAEFLDDEAGYRGPIYEHTHFRPRDTDAGVKPLITKSSLRRLANGISF